VNVLMDANKKMNRITSWDTCIILDFLFGEQLLSPTLCFNQWMDMHSWELIVNKSHHIHKLNSIQGQFNGNFVCSNKDIEISNLTTYQLRTNNIWKKKKKSTLKINKTFKISSFKKSDGPKHIEWYLIKMYMLNKSSQNIPDECVQDER